jgi:hypothetical protein
MDIVRGVTRLITGTAEAAAAAAGAVGGAAITGVIGGVQGTVSGIRSGLADGSHSTPAAALTLGVIGAAGLVEWPVLLTVGGTALVVHQLSKRSEGQPEGASVTPINPASSGGGGRPRKSTPRESTSATRKSAPRKDRRRPSSFDQSYVLS